MQGGAFVRHDRVEDCSKTRATPALFPCASHSFDFAQRSCVRGLHEWDKAKPGWLISTILADCHVRIANSALGAATSSSPIDPVTKL